MTDPAATTANFVDIIGYSLEKIHTGMLAWLLDTTWIGCKELTNQDKCNLIQRLFELDLNSDEVKTITTIKEDSPGNRIRSDLRIVVETGERDHWIVVEAKTESDVNPKQLETMEDAYRNVASRLEQHPALHFALLMFGASQFTVRNTTPVVKDTWVQKDLKSIEDSISSLSTKHAYIETWHSSLQKRHEELNSVTLRWQVGKMSRPDYYALLDQIRSELVQIPGSKDSKWCITNGQFNAAMYGRSFPKAAAARERLGTFFWWDIDDDYLVLKGQANQTQADRWNTVKEVARNVISTSAGLVDGGERTRNRSGADQSLWKWRVIGDNPDPADIAKLAYGIITKVEARLADEFGFQTYDV